MRSLLVSLIGILFISGPFVSAQENVEIDNQVAVGASNSDSQVQELLELFGVEDATTPIFIDGETLNHYLNDGSTMGTGVYSSVMVNSNSDINGVTVEILTPMNITEVSSTAYQNAAITAGATNAEIKIAAVQPVTGEGALAGVYEVFYQAGYVLETSDIEAAEYLIEIEQILQEETNMSDTEISKLVTEYNLSIINSLEENDTLNEQEILIILNDILVNYNYQFSENVRSMLVTHGLVFSQSDVSRDPQTKAALEIVMSRYEVFDQIYNVEDIEVKFKDIYFTDERDKFEEIDYDNILRLNYIVTNNGDTDISAGYEITLYVDGQQANNYYLSGDSGSMVSPNRSVEVTTSYAFNGSRQNLELEVRDERYWNNPLIIKLSNDGTPISGNMEEVTADQPSNVGSGLTDETRSKIENEELTVLLDGFVEAGLNVMEPRLMTRHDYGIAPLLADEAVQFGAQYAEYAYDDEEGNEELYNYGRMFLVNDLGDLATMKEVYDELGRQSAFLYSHTHSKGNILLQMGSDVPDEDFEKYVEVINSIID